MYYSVNLDQSCRTEYWLSWPGLMGSMLDKGFVLVLHHNFFKIGNSVNKFNMVQGKFEGVGNLETDMNNICGKKYFTQWITRQLPYELASNFKIKSTRTTIKMENISKKEHKYPQNRKIATINIYQPTRVKFSISTILEQHLLYLHTFSHICLERTWGGVKTTVT